MRARKGLLDASDCVEPIIPVVKTLFLAFRHATVSHRDAYVTGRQPLRNHLAPFLRFREESGIHIVRAFWFSDDTLFSTRATDARRKRVSSSQGVFRVLKSPQPTFS